MSDTNVGWAMRKAGYNPRDAAMMVALSKFENNGGTFDRLIELARAAYGGALVHGGNGHLVWASARPSNGDGTVITEGHAARADKAALDLPSADREGVGQIARAAKARTPLPAPRAPSAADLKAMAAGAKKVAATILDSFTVPGFRGVRGHLDAGHNTPLGDIPANAWKRIENWHKKNAWVGGRYAELARIMRVKIEKQAHIPSGSLTRDIIGAAEAERMIAEATYTADVQRCITIGVATALKDVIPVGETAHV